jgi:hypothetical protein
MHQLTCVVHRLERRQPRMQPEATVEIEGALTLAGTRDRDRGTCSVIVFVAMRHDDVQTIRGAAQKYAQQDLGARTRQRSRRVGPTRAGLEQQAQRRQRGSSQQRPARKVRQQARFHWR